MLVTYAYFDKKSELLFRSFLAQNFTLSFVVIVHSFAFHSCNQFHSKHWWGNESPPVIALVILLNDILMTLPVTEGLKQLPSRLLVYYVEFLMGETYVFFRKVLLYLLYLLCICDVENFTYKCCIVSSRICWVIGPGSF